jgi:hypothetical protein
MPSIGIKLSVTTGESGGGGSPPAPVDNIILEDGTSNLLLEDGTSLFLLES